MVAFTMGLKGWKQFHQVAKVKKGIPGEEIHKSKNMDMGKHQVSLDRKELSVARAQWMVIRLTVAFLSTYPMLGIIVNPLPTLNFNLQNPLRHYYLHFTDRDTVYL